MPKEVISRARGYLRSLENQQSQPQGPQSGFDFSVPEPEGSNELQNAVDSLDPDSMTPREALDKLYELKKL